MSADGQDLRVAILDDDPALCQFLSDIVRQQGMIPVVSTDPKDIAALLKPTPKVFMLDLSMPSRDGLDVIRELAERKINSQIILMTGHDDQILSSVRELATRRGLNVTGALRKPLPVEELRSLLATPADTGLHRALTFMPSLGEADMLDALKKRRIGLYFQPQVRIDDGSWVGVEALARWHHPEHGVLAPGSFRHLIDAPALAPQFCLSTITLGLMTFKAMMGRRIGFDGTMSVNLSQAAMVDEQFSGEVLAMCEQVGCGPDRLLLEITETALPADPLRAMHILTSLRLKGFKLSVDDFGTGHASLEQLQFLPFSEVKIDIGFVRAAEQSFRSRAIVENIVSLAKRVGLKVVAEGVETRAAWQWLRDIGCDYAQGYLISRPVPVEKLPAWRENWRRSYQLL